ncbi:MAG: hypothetical protein QM579_01385 [Desulfovibrio sp.]|uniref:hypothetical protein n=1 Tax=Desulfovibrio sp. TaxID=885 RepID=UPI0039E3C8A1
MPRPLDTVVSPDFSNGGFVNSNDVRLSPMVPKPKAMIVFTRHLRRLRCPRQGAGQGVPCGDGGFFCARRCAGAEKRCWQLAAAWLGLKVGDEDIITPYNEDYDDNTINKLDKTFVLELARLNMISKATALVQLKKLGTLPEDFEPDDEQDKVAQELMTNGGASGANSLLNSLGLGGGSI